MPEEQGLISEALKCEISDWAGEMKDTEEDIAQYESNYVAITILEVEEVPFTLYSDRSPVDLLGTEVEPAVIDEHGLMLGQTDEVLNLILEGNENVVAFTPTPE